MAARGRCGRAFKATCETDTRNEHIADVGRNSYAYIACIILFYTPSLSSRAISCASVTDRVVGVKRKRNDDPRSSFRIARPRTLTLHFVVCIIHAHMHRHGLHYCAVLRGDDRVEKCYRFVRAKASKGKKKKKSEQT